MSKIIPKTKQKKIALDQVDNLFNLALSSPDLADRYVHLAKKIAIKTRTGLPSIFKRTFCTNCNNNLVTDGRKRINNHKITIYCHKCKKFQRIPLK
jgi:ribonuclease P protein subunit RPR2